jgi:hypothetical protein
MISNFESYLAKRLAKGTNRAEIKRSRVYAVGYVTVSEDNLLLTSWITLLVIYNRVEYFMLLLALRIIIKLVNNHAIDVNVN